MGVGEGGGAWRRGERDGVFDCVLKFEFKKFQTYFGLDLQLRNTNSCLPSSRGGAPLPQKLKFHFLKILSCLRFSLVSLELARI